MVVSLPRHCGLLWISLAGSVGVGLFALGRRLRCLRGKSECEATVAPAVRVYVCCVNAALVVCWNLSAVQRECGIPLLARWLSLLRLPSDFRAL